VAIKSKYNEGKYNDGIYNLTLSISGSLVALILDGKGQYMGTPEPDALDIGDTWTLGIWSRPLDNPEHATVFSTAAPRDLRNEINISSTPISTPAGSLEVDNASLRVIIKDENGTTIKHISWSDYFQYDQWTHVFLQWDGTELNAFKNGAVTVTGSAFVNSSGTMADSPDRFTYYGAAVGPYAPFSGSIGHLALWDTILAEEEFGTVVSGAFDIDLLTSTGTYVSSASLKHWWQPGQDQSDIGRDYAGSLGLDKLQRIDIDNVLPDEPIV